ncbi:MAG: hypothetical protein MSC30_07140 [Gaiellaceae bacterium MAG52_C11]|nr:hypothetical protein [Candidatus Gaiellasilicea maunaloa]
MPSYLVEAYLPRSLPDEADAAGRRARAAADELFREGTPIRYVRTTFLPDDETCFHLFEADSADAVAVVCRRARLGHARIVPAIEASRSRRSPAR